MKAVFISMSNIPGIKKMFFLVACNSEKMELPSNSVKVMVVVVVVFFRLIGFFNSRLIP